MQGKIEKIENCGTIVQVWLRGCSRPINFDHRAFGWLWEAEEGNLSGREVEYDDVIKTIHFLDGEEVCQE